MNETLIILLESIVIGGLIGFGASAGVARMFHAPKVQGMGAFRTLGELNACESDPVAHFSFGLGFVFNAWASAIGTGALTQDIDHRIIPHWAAALSLVRNRDLESTLHNPKRMGIVGACIGTVLVAALNTTVAAIPDALRSVASKVLIPASEWLINPVMPIIFWLAAMDAGRKTGAWGTALGGAAHIVMGNAVPGIVLGILIGKGVEDGGWNKITITLTSAVATLFVVSAFFRGVDLQLLNQMHAGIPGWLQHVHDSLGANPE